MLDYLKAVCILCATAIMFTLLWVAHANAEPLPTEGKARVGEVITVRFACQSQEILEVILGKSTDAKVTYSANMALRMGLCVWAPDGVTVTLREYVGWLDMNLESDGRAHMYRVEDSQGAMHYAYMFIEHRGA